MGRVKARNYIPKAIGDEGSPDAEQGPFAYDSYLEGLCSMQALVRTSLNNWR